MTDTVAILLLVVFEVAGLLLVPLGLPSLWVMVLGLVGYGWLMNFQSVGLWTTTLVLALALLGELVETWLGLRFAAEIWRLEARGLGRADGGLVGALVEGEVL